MADYTRILFARTDGNIMHPMYSFSTGNTGTIVYAEPWVQRNQKQLWIDNVCINPDIVFSTNFGNLLVNPQELFTKTTTQDSTSKKVTSTVVFDYTKLLDNLDESFNTFRIQKGQTPYQIYSPTDSLTVHLLLGDNMNITKPSDTYLLDSEYIDSLSIVDGQTIGGNYISGHSYLDIESTFGNHSYVDLSGIAGSTYSGGNKITITNNVINHDTTTVTPTSSAETLSHGQSFFAVSEVRADSYGHLTEYTVKEYKLPAAEGSGGSGMIQDIYAEIGTPLDQTTTDSNSFKIKVSGSDNEVVLIGPSTSSLNNDGNDVRFALTTATDQSQTMTRYSVDIKIHTIDGGVIS